MAKFRKIYRCPICGNIVEVLHEGNGELVCCGKPMEELVEKTEDVGAEKHVPVIEFRDDSVVVSVGDTLHPMEENHYIEFVELFVGEDTRYIEYLKPGDTPIVTFKVPFDADEEQIHAREYCSVHGLWISE